MKKLTYYLVDVFAEEKYTGNQLVVIIGAKGLSDHEMQRLAKEMNYSETTFVLSNEKRKGGYDVRIFTPAKELPFAGHPTLGTAFVIQHSIIKEPIHKILLNLKIGQIPVRLSYAKERVDVLWMNQIPPIFGQTFDAELISEILTLNVSEIDVKFPIQEVSTGLPTIIVPLKTLNALKCARISQDKYFGLIKNTQAKTILIFSPKTYNEENNLNVRFFADYFGIREDPATGSANGCLAGYLVKHRYFGKDRINIRVEQGYEIGRPSLLLLKAREYAGEIQVNVGGKVIMIAKGELI